MNGSVTHLSTAGKRSGRLNRWWKFLAKRSNRVSVRVRVRVRDSAAFRMIRWTLAHARR